MSWRKFNTIVLSLVVLLVGNSCSNKNSDNGTIFPEATETAWTVISGNDEILPQSPQICINDSSIFVVDELDGKWIHRYGRNDGQLKERMISYGQGPDEIINGSFAPITMLKDDSLVVINDLDLKLLKLVKISGKPKVVKQINTAEFVANPFIAQYVDPKRILIENFDFSRKQLNRAYVLVKDSRAVSTYINFPEDETTAKMIQNFPVSRCGVAVSPDGRHIAVGYLRGGVLEMFAVEDTVLREVYSHAFHPQEKPGDQEKETWESTMIRAFSAARATNKYVFLVYSGETTPETDNKIAIFDWKGNPVKLIKTDCQIVAFDIDEKTSELYAITIPGEDGETQISKLSYTLP